MKVQQLTGGQAVVQALLKSGIQTLYGLPGVQNDWLFNALYDYQKEIKVIHTRHEQGAAYMALGHYLATGQHTVYSVVPGPGFLNSSAALATMWGLYAKVLCLVGQIPQKAQGRSIGALHEIPDQMGILRRLTKWAMAVPKAAATPRVMATAFQQMHEGIPRPVGVEVAMNVLAQSARIDFSNFSAQPTPKALTMPIEEALALIEQSKQIMIVVSGGAMHASEQVRRLAEHLQAPVFAYRTGKGILPSSHELSFPLPAAYPLWPHCDLCIAIGSQARMPLLQWGVDDQLKLLSINIDPQAHHRIKKSEVAITADTQVALQQLNEALSSHSPPRPKASLTLQHLRKAWAKQSEYLTPQSTYLKVIREELPPDGILVDELTQIGFASRMLWETDYPRTYLSTGQMGTLGWGFQAALGAKSACPDKVVLSLTGDGGFLFGLPELATAVQHQLGVIILLFNNNAYGNVRSMQERDYGQRIIASDLHNPDFVKMALAFGAAAQRVHSFDQLRQAIRKARDRDLPTLIEVPVDNNWPSTNRLKKLKRIRG
ncbi:MAG: thiamine pyrophosphate-dependent enzyme [Bacteroidota bacterium]